MSEPQPGPSKNTNTNVSASSSSSKGKRKNGNTTTFFEEPKKLRGFAKHAVLKSYLDAWFPIMLKNYSQLVYVDGFAGPGLHEDNEHELEDEKPTTVNDQLGSPILIYKALAEHTNLKGKGGKITLIFFETEEEFYKKLEKNIEQAKQDYPIQNKVKIETEVHHGDFNKLMDDVLERFLGAAMFVFVDPFGYNMKMSTLQNILSTHTRASPRELFLNLMDGSLRRFIHDEQKHKSQDKLLGVGDPDDPEDNWREKCRDATPDEKLNIISKFYIRRLQEGQFKIYVLKFAMKDDRNHHVYHLVYVTCHLKGLDVMKTNMSNNSLGASSFVFSEWFAEKNLRMVRDIKEDKPGIAKDLLQRLTEKFSLTDQENEVCGNEILEFILVHTLYPTNVKNALKKVMKEDGIKVPTKGAFERKIFTFPKKPDISSSLDNQMTKEVNLNGIKNDGPVSSSSGNEPPTKKKRASK